MGWRLRIYFDDGTEELIEDVFDTEEAAKAELRDWLEGWAEGGEVLQLAGEPYSDAEIEEWDIWEE